MSIIFPLLKSSIKLSKQFYLYSFHNGSNVPKYPFFRSKMDVHFQTSSKIFGRSFTIKSPFNCNILAIFFINSTIFEYSCSDCPLSPTFDYILMIFDRYFQFTQFDKILKPKTLNISLENASNVYVLSHLLD